MVTKLSRLKAAYTAGQPLVALQMAARFPRLGEHAEVISRGWAAHQNPQFYREIGRDPEALVAAGVAAVAAKFRL